MHYHYVDFNWTRLRWREGVGLTILRYFPNVQTCVYQKARVRKCNGYGWGNGYGGQGIEWEWDGVRGRMGVVALSWLQYSVFKWSVWPTPITLTILNIPSSNAIGTATNPERLNVHMLVIVHALCMSPSL